MKKGKFPSFWVIVLLFGILWFAKEVGLLWSNFDFPWLPAILIIFAVGAIYNRIN